MSRHRGGAGLDKGADLTAGRKHYRWLVKEARMKEAGALMSNMSGALWPPKRLIENKIVNADDTAAYCPRCGEHGVDEGHLFWECPGIQSGSHPIIPKTNRYCREYCSHNTAENQCWYWRGIMPSEWTEVPPPTQLVITQLGGRLTAVGNTIVVFTDGSGGETPATQDCADADGHGL